MPTNQEMQDAVEAELKRISGAPNIMLTEAACALQAGEMVARINFDADGYSDLITALNAMPDCPDPFAGAGALHRARVKADEIAGNRSLPFGEIPNPESCDKPADIPDP